MGSETNTRRRLVVAVTEDGPIAGAARTVDEASDGLITALRDSGDIPAQSGKTTMIHHPRGIPAERLLVEGGYASLSAQTVAKAAGVKIEAGDITVDEESGTAVNIPKITVGQEVKKGDPAHWMLKEDEWYIDFKSDRKQCG